MPSPTCCLCSVVTLGSLFVSAISALLSTLGGQSLEGHLPETRPGSSEKSTEVQGSELDGGDGTSVPPSDQAAPEGMLLPNLKQHIYFLLKRIAQGFPFAAAKEVGGSERSKMLTDPGAQDPESRAGRLGRGLQPVGPRQAEQLLPRLGGVAA